MNNKSSHFYKIKIDQNILEPIFEKALTAERKSRSNFFYEIRKSFKEAIEEIFETNGIKVIKDGQIAQIKINSSKIVDLEPLPKPNKTDKLDTKYCANYGHDIYSLQVLNADMTSGYYPLPSLNCFFKYENFTIGNIAIQVDNNNYEIGLELPENIKIVGFSQDISSRKIKSNFCLYGIRFKKTYLNPIFEKYLFDCDCKKEDLDEIRIGTIKYPILFICRKCGQLYTCICFKRHFSFNNDIARFVRYSREQAGRIKIKKNICHLCTKEVPKLLYGHKMYYTSFLQRYFPYYKLYALRRYREMIFTTTDERSKEIENELRLEFGYPKIGEKWINETALFKIVETFFPDKEVIHHYRGKELEGLELDIWISDFRLGIEYQGEQHYMAIEHWGGEEGLKERIRNDKKKKNLCKTLGYKLIEFKYSEDLTVETVERKLKYFLRRKRKV